MPKMIPEETKQQAIRLVLDHLDQYPNLSTACAAVSARLGFGAESLRRWVRQAQVDGVRIRCGARHESPLERIARDLQAMLPPS